MLVQQCASLFGFVRDRVGVGVKTGVGVRSAIGVRDRLGTWIREETRGQSPHIYLAGD